MQFLPKTVIMSALAFGLFSHQCRAEPGAVNAADSTYIHVPRGEATDPGLDAATDERISSTIVSVDWHHRDIADALHDLEVLCHRASPKEPRVKFRLNFGPNGIYGDPKSSIRRDVTFSFEKYSVRRLLGDLAMFTQTGFAIQRNEIVFVPTPWREPAVLAKIRVKFPTLFIGPRADMEE